MNANATSSAGGPAAGAHAADADPLAPVFAQDPLHVVSAEGVWLRTQAGRRVLDLYGGLGRSAKRA